MQVQVASKNRLHESSLRAKMLWLLGSKDAKIVILFEPLNAVSWLQTHGAVT